MDEVLVATFKGLTSLGAGITIGACLTILCTSGQNKDFFTVKNCLLSISIVIASATWFYLWGTSL